MELQEKYNEFINEYFRFRKVMQNESNDTFDKHEMKEMFKIYQLKKIADILSKKENILNE